MDINWFTVRLLYIQLCTKLKYCLMFLSFNKSTHEQHYICFSLYENFITPYNVKKNNIQIIVNFKKKLSYLQLYIILNNMYKNILKLPWIIITYLTLNRA